MELTPEVVEKIKKAGIPLWAITGGVIGLGSIGANEEDPKLEYSVGGAVDPPGSDDLDDNGVPDDLQEYSKAVGEALTPDHPMAYTPHSQRSKYLQAIANRYGDGPMGKWLKRANMRFLEQMYGLNEKGDLVPLGFDLNRKGMSGAIRPGLVDETVGLPVQMTGHGPEMSHSAAERSNRLHELMNQYFQMDDPSGFADWSADSFGTMVGQLPVGEAPTIAKAGKGVLKGLSKIPKSLWEYFSPTVVPKGGNYLAGTAAGGALGSVSEHVADFLENHPQFVKNLKESMAYAAQDNPYDLYNGMAEGGPVHMGLGGKLKKIGKKVLKASVNPVEGFKQTGPALDAVEKEVGSWGPVGQTLTQFGQALRQGLVKGVLHDPSRLLTGVDPVSTGLWNKVLGTHKDPLVNLYGGPTPKTLDDIDANPYTRTGFKVADAVAAYYGGQGALRGLGKIPGAIANNGAVPAASGTPATGDVGNPFDPDGVVTGNPSGAVSSGAAPATSAPSGASGLLNYLKNNPGQALKGLGIVGTLYNGLNKPKVPTTPEIEGPPPPNLPMMRQNQLPADFDWNHYGEGPEQRFFVPYDKSPPNQLPIHLDPMERGV